MRLPDDKKLLTEAEAADYFAFRSQMLYPVELRAPERGN